MKKYYVFVLLTLVASAVFAQAFDLKGSLDWVTMELKAQTVLNLASTNIKLPSGRVNAEEIIDAEYARIIRPAVLALLVDSSRTIGDLLKNGELESSNIDILSRPASQIPPALSADMTLFTASYIISLKNISNLLMRHSKPAPIRTPLTPLKTSIYTGIVIIAAKALPIYGRNTESLIQPCLFPKIWDSDMSLIYEKNMTDPSKSKNGIVKYVSEEAIFRNTPSGMDAELEALVGNNPLRVIARGVFGEKPTDPIIDREDALFILSSEANLKLLRESRIIIVLDQSILKASF